MNAIQTQEKCQHGYDIACLLCRFGTVNGQRIYHDGLDHTTQKATGHRIDCEILDHPEDYLSPNCKKFEEQVK